MLDDGTVLPELDRLFEPETSIGTAPYPYWTPTYTPSFQDNYCRRALYVSESFGPQIFCEVDAMEDSLFLACGPRQKPQHGNQKARFSQLFQLRTYAITADN